MKTLCLLFFLSPLLSVGQSYFKDHFGGKIGVVVDFGSKVNGVGVTFNGYYTDYFYQFNASGSLFFYSSSYGKRKRFWESRNAAGLVLLAGKRQSKIDFQFDGLNHQTSYNYGLGYNYIWYFDKAETSQRSGGFSIHLKNLSIYHENDVFAGSAEDKFRTGHFLISYRTDHFKFATGLNIWTGETAGAPTTLMVHDKMRKGYKDLRNSKYGKTSHGVGYISMVSNLPYQQHLHLKIGVDSEHLRHAIQNRFIHDLMFLPKKYKRNSYHYPMLNKKGEPVFNKHEVRPSLFYMQFGLNQNWSN